MSAPPLLSCGQHALLGRIPDRGDTLGLYDAVAIVSRYDRLAYGLIVDLMNRSLVSTSFLDTPSVDPDIVIRRL